jgi:hypothetical protein
MPDRETESRQGCQDMPGTRAFSLGAGSKISAKMELRLMSTLNRQDGHYIYTARIRTKTGRVIYAWQYGLKAFKIWVRNK